MNNNNEIRNDVNVINKGKIPKNITSNGKTKPITKGFKVTPAQNEQIEAAIDNGGFKSFSEYVLHMLFDGAPIITIAGGRDILIKLSECADLFNAMSDNADYNSNAGFDKLIDKFSEIELSISQIFDYIDMIKNGFINETEDK